MEELILESPVSSDEKLFRESALKAYQVIQSQMETVIDFETFFDGKLKRPFSYELAARDAVIYYCSTLLDSKNLVDACTELFRIDAKKLMFIISQHEERMNGKGFYYRTFIKRLMKTNDIVKPNQPKSRLDLSRIKLEDYIKILSDILFEEIREKTGITKESIMERNRVNEIATCRMLFSNIFLAQPRPVKLKLIGLCIGIDHSDIIYYRKKHQDYLLKCSYDVVPTNARRYMELYKHITVRVQERLKKKLH